MAKFTLSDILRHIVVGIFSIFFIIALFDGCLAFFQTKNLFSINEWNWVFLLVIGYILGILIQSLNKGLQGFRGYKFSNFLFRNYAIKEKSRLLQKKPRKNTPEWICATKNPEKIIEYIEIEIENKKNAIVNEYFYLSELFQGLYIASFFLLPFHLFQYFSKDPKPLAGLMVGILLASAIISYCCAHFYTKRFIYSLDAYKDVLEIGLDKYMRKLGVQRVFVMMRTKTRSVHLRDALHSVFRQSYYDINLILLEDGVRPTLMHTITQLRQEYQEKSISVRYYNTETNSPAKSSYTIRNIILNIADREDDIIFILDDDDLFAHNNAVSDVVHQMNKKKADICLVKYNIIGEPHMHIAYKGGDTHNNLTTKIYKQDKSVTIEEAPCLCFASSLGWSKIYRMKMLKNYFLTINETKDNEQFEDKNLVLESYEDFPDFLVFLFPNTRVTGLNDPIYLYRKHESSATRTITKQAFQKWRIDQLRLLVIAAEGSSANNKLIKNYKKFLTYYLLLKTDEIRTVIDKYTKEGRLNDYSESDFDDDLAASELQSYIQLEPEIRKDYETIKDCTNKVDTDDNKKPDLCDSPKKGRWFFLKNLADWGIWRRR